MATVKRIYNKLMDNDNLKHIMKFGFVGCLNTLFDFGIFSLLNVLFGINYIISQITSYFSGTLNSYLFNRLWTFNDTRSNKKTTMEILQFIFVNLTSLSVSLISLSILMKNNFLNSFFAKITSMILAQIVNFLGYKFWVFGRLVNLRSNTKEE